MKEDQAGLNRRKYDEQGWKRMNEDEKDENGWKRMNWDEKDDRE